MRFLSLLPLLSVVSAMQIPHLPTPQEALSAAGSFIHGAQEHPSTSLGYANDLELASIGGDEHVTVTSASHPNHKIRIKSHHGWCDPGVKSYSGYLDVGYGKDLFFYFFESRSKPKEDPVIMWINGGPGCSSSLGLFMELGPCKVKDDPKGVNDTEYNPYGWNDKANIFFLDEPIGVGFSEAENGQVVGRTEEAAKDVAAFISIFFDAFKEFKGREFHMAGESYGGRYLPVFASELYDQNKMLEKDGKTPINLQSLMIGNGVTNYFKAQDSMYPMMCTVHGGLTAPVQTIGHCVTAAENLPKCDKYLRKGCFDTLDYTSCMMAMFFCQEIWGDILTTAGVNPYDVSKACTPEELQTSLCYNETNTISTYLDLPEVRSLLGVHKHRPAFASCSNVVGHEFGVRLDMVGQTWLYVANLLERGIRVLDYVGTFDFMCNHFEQASWLNALEWTGKEGYAEAKTVDWKVDGKVAGDFKTHGNLTFLRIFKAGHMVPFDKPVEALTMVNAWLEAGAISA